MRQPRYDLGSQRTNLSQAGPSTHNLPLRTINQRYTEVRSWVGQGTAQAHSTLTSVKEIWVRLKYLDRMFNEGQLRHMPGMIKVEASASTLDPSTT